jgi:hypothetical protein
MPPPTAAVARGLMLAGFAEPLLTPRLVRGDMRHLTKRPFLTGAGCRSGDDIRRERAGSYPRSSGEKLGRPVLWQRACRSPTLACSRPAS